MRLSTFLLPIALAGCAAGLPASQPQTPVPEGAADTCGAAPFAHLVGQPATALEQQLIMRPVRVLRGGDPGDPEMPARLTFHIATPAAMPANVPLMIAERVIAITCG